MASYTFFVIRVSMSRYLGGLSNEFVIDCNFDYRSRSVQLTNVLVSQPDWFSFFPFSFFHFFSFLFLSFLLLFFFFVFSFLFPSNSNRSIMTDKRRENVETIVTRNNFSWLEFEDRRARDAKIIFSRSIAERFVKKLDGVGKYNNTDKLRAFFFFFFFFFFLLRYTIYNPI